MHILCVQGIRAGVGASTVVANLARILRELNQDVLVFDLNPSNLLRLHFNMDWQNSSGWALNICEQKSWHDAGFQCEQGVHFLPFGQINYKNHQVLMSNYISENWLSDTLNSLDLLDESWIILNVPSELNALNIQALNLSDIILRIFEPSVACLSQLINSMQSSYIHNDNSLSNKSYYLMNKLMPSSEIDYEMILIFNKVLSNKTIPVNIHFDENIKEAFAHQTTVTLHAPNSASAKEFRTIAIWLISYFKRRSKNYVSE